MIDDFDEDQEETPKERRRRLFEEGIRADERRRVLQNVEKAADEFVSGLQQKLNSLLADYEKIKDALEKQCNNPQLVCPHCHAVIYYHKMYYCRRCGAHYCYKCCNPDHEC